jgi:prepilin-type N-terminal cleavage/methylation domain-containing protein/prepilin-type processing-associated H-X9-DG protein
LVIESSISIAGRFDEERIMFRNQRGFTLVELLVVIAIIGILIALLLPAVQAAREAARRSQCTNNLKQISLAVHNYVDTYNAFPMGNYSCCWGTWLISLCPYIELKTLAEKYQGGGWVGPGSTQPSWYSASVNFPVTKTQVAAYTCPSDTPSASPGLQNGLTFHNYVGNYGNTTEDRSSPYGVDSAGNPNRWGGAPFVGVTIASDQVNPSAVPPVVRFASIQDGLSNSLLFSETVQGKSGDLRGFAWWHGGCHFETYLSPNSAEPDRLQSASYCVASDAMNPPCTAATEGPYSGTVAARSRHPGGVNAALCDGSVRFISNTIYLDTWRGLGTIRGAETLDEF